FSILKKRSKPGTDAPIRNQPLSCAAFPFFSCRVTYMSPGMVTSATMKRTIVILQVRGVHSGGKRHSVNAVGEDNADEFRCNQQPRGNAVFRTVNERIQQVLQADV